jgi:bacterioferritin
MHGDPRIIDLLNQVLRKELTGINQYFIQSRMCKNWGYAVLEKVHHDEAIEEMKHADLVIQADPVPRGSAQPGRLRPDPCGSDSP